MRYSCPYAYRTGQYASLRCRKQQEQQQVNNFCAHQYMCHQTRRWENTSEGRGCKIKDKPFAAENKKEVKPNGAVEAKRAGRGKSKKLRSDGGESGVC